MYFGISAKTITSGWHIAGDARIFLVEFRVINYQPKTRVDFRYVSGAHNK